MTSKHPSSASTADAKARRIAQWSARADQAEARGDLAALVRIRDTILRLSPSGSGPAFDAGYAHTLVAEQAEERGDPQAAARHQQQAEARYRRELQGNPRCAVTHNNLSNLRAMKARSLAATDPAAAIAIWREAIAFRSRATQLDPGYALAARNLGNGHADLAALLRDTDLRAARRHWAQAAKAYARALALDPADADAAEWAGDALAAEACAIADDDPRAALECRTAALDRHAFVLRLRPRDPTAAIDCARDLRHLAELNVERDRPAARRLWNQARRHYRLALQLDPTLVAAEHDLGMVCLDEAGALAEQVPKQAQALLTQAAGHFAAALARAPDTHDSARCLGEALSLHAGLLVATDLPGARRLWRRAASSLQRAQRQVPDDRWPAVLLARAAIAEAEALVHVDPAAALRLCRLASRRYRSLLALPLPASGAQACYVHAQHLCEGAEAELNARSKHTRLLWRGAADGFLEAARRNPRRAWVWNDAGCALAELALTWRDAGSQAPAALRREVIRCCRQALRIDPRHHAAHTQWGNVCAVEARLAGADQGRAGTQWQQAIAHHQKALALRRDKAFSLRRLASVHADHADALATTDATAAADARATALACLAEALRDPGTDADAIWTDQAWLKLRFAGADQNPAAQRRAMQRVARRLLARLDRGPVTRSQTAHPRALALARAAAEAALGNAEACVAALEMAVLLGDLNDLDDIDRHPAFDPVQDEVSFQRWRRLRFGAARLARA